MKDAIQKLKSSFSNNTIFKVLKLNYKKLSALLIVISYIFFVVVSMGPSIWKCNDTLSGVGDNTGGPIWRLSLEPKQPLLGGFEKQTNYPYGENLYSPVGYASILQTAMLKGSAKIVGPVCAYNSINAIGYLMSALAMCAFIYYLTKKLSIAWLAGFAVAFTPYAQSKVGGHPSYGYVAFLIFVLWSALLVIQKAKIRYSLLLGISLAVCAYFDPYFILLALTVLAPVVLYWMVNSLFEIKKGTFKKEKFIKIFKAFIVAALSFFLLIAPLVYVRIAKSAEITTNTNAVRGDVKAAAQLCSNLPSDYLIPDPYNLVLTNLFGLEYTKNNISIRHWCNSGESRVSISLTAIGTIFAAAVILLYRKRLKKKNKLNIKQIDSRLLIYSVIGVGLAAILIGLPPQIKGLIMPSYLIIYITKTWRIFAREYLVVNMAVIILFSISLAYIYELMNMKKWKKYFIPLIFLLFGLIVFEYQYHDPFRTFNFSYQRDVPSVYRDIKKDPNVTAIAEYPLDRLGIEADSIVYYTTMQTVHNKPLLNSALGNNPKEKLHIAIKDLSDPQTIPLLRSLGITHVVIHGMSANEVSSKTDQLEVLKEEEPVVYGLKLIRDLPSNKIVFAKIKQGPKLDSAIVIDKGFVVNNLIMKDSFNMEYELLPKPNLKVIPIKDKGISKVCFDVRLSGDNESSNLNILVNGIKYASYTIGSTYSTIEVTAKNNDTITLDNTNNHNLRINNLGCKI